MDYKYYQRKLNDIINKCPIEAGVEILAYNLLDSVINPDEFSVIDINSLRKNRDCRLTTLGGISDIAIVSNDFVYKKIEDNKRFAFVEVKAPSHTLSKTEQIIGQINDVNHFLYTNGLVWKYYNDNNVNNPLIFYLDINKRKSIYKPIERLETVNILIDEDEFNELIEFLKGIDWKS